MRFVAAALPLAACLGLVAAPEPELRRFEGVEPHMGTLVRVVVYTPDETSAKRALRAAFDRIAELDAILSDYKPQSELTRLTTSAVGQPVTVSDDLFAVLAASQELAHATGGAFDITQGLVVRLWREARKAGRVPDAAALEEASSRSGFRKLHLNPFDRTVRLAVAGMALDVGAIGKGYAASEALEALTSLGVRSALVAVSGDLAFSAAPPGQRGWRIDVHSLDASATSIPKTLELTHAAVSTSGPSEQHVDIGGTRYSHVIDPASRMGLVDDITVTVIAPHGVEADGLDTAVSVLGLEQGLELIASRPNTAALIVERTARGSRVVASPEFVELAAGAEAPSQRH